MIAMRLKANQKTPKTVCIDLAALVLVDALLLSLVQDRIPGEEKGLPEVRRLACT
jgi:hypothetical protein